MRNHPLGLPPSPSRMLDLAEKNDTAGQGSVLQGPAPGIEKLLEDVNVKYVAGSSI